MIDKLLFEYKKKNKYKALSKDKSHSLSKNKEIIKANLSESKTKYKQKNKNLYKRNILFSSKQSIINLKSTSTSSFSSSTEKKYLTPSKYNYTNCDNDYYFNESYNKTQELFNNANISRPKLDYNNSHKKNKNILTIGTRINTTNSDIFGESRVLMINRSFKVNKNKYVICRKNNFLNNKKIQENKKDIESKSAENNHKNNQIEENLYKNLEIKNNANEEKIKINNLSTFNNKEKKYKNIVLRPHKIKTDIQLKYNIKVNNYEIEDSPKIINKIMTRLNIKPKNSRVFKYK